MGKGQKDDNGGGLSTQFHSQSHNRFFNSTTMLNILLVARDGCHRRETRLQKIQDKLQKVVVDKIFQKNQKFEDFRVRLEV